MNIQNNQIAFNTLINEANTHNNVKIISSLEIAEITSKLHKNIIVDIEKMFLELEIDSAEKSAQYKDASGKTNKCYNLDEEMSMTLVSGYNVKLRNAIVKVWQEKKQELKNNKDIRTSSRLLIDQVQLLLEELDNKDKENAYQSKTIETQNITNKSLLEAKAGQFKTNKQLLKNDLGKEINIFVSKYFLLNSDSMEEAHKEARKTYQNNTGNTYLGAKATSLEAKSMYADWLRQYKQTLLID